MSILQRALFLVAFDGNTISERFINCYANLE